MRSLLYRFRLLFAVAVAIVPVCGWSATAHSSLTAEQVIQKAVHRAESPISREGRPNYSYTKHTVTEDLDTRGNVKDTKDKLYEVSVESGMSYLKLLQLNGQNLSSAALKKEGEHEAAERQKMFDTKPGKKGDERENFLTSDLAQKFNYTLVGENLINGRNSYELTFEPKSDLPVKKLTDRFVNQVAGTVWIDAEDFEIAKAQIHLQAEVALWGGVIGTLRHCRFTMERTRMPDGTWFNSYSRGVFEGRKLLEPMFIKTRSDSSNFHRASGSVQ
jgi:hypothetical protein